jgi:sugar lactone lactonase YvrE
MKIHGKYICFLFVLGILPATIIMIGTQTLFNLNILYAQNNNILKASNKSLEKVWESPNQLKNPESVVYDSKKNMLYVSNVDGNPDDKDNKGFISIISPTNGSIINLNWVSNLNAPKGIDLDNNTGKLYVSDITNLIEIDLSSGKIINRYPALDNSSLNDVVIDKKGNVFVSDPPNNAIFTLDTKNNSATTNVKSLQIWLKSKELNGPNGITIDDSKNILVISSMGKGTPEAGGTVKAIGLDNKTIISIGKEGRTVPVGILDGLQIGTDGKSYYVSDWNAKNIHIVDTSGKGYRELFNSPMQGMADFRIIYPEKELVIPLMPENKIIALRINTN